MDFDACEHKMRLLLIQFGQYLNPEEKDVTKLYRNACNALQIPVVMVNSLVADHLPAPWEMKDEKGEFFVPRKKCPKCGKENSLILASICAACKDSENGKFKSAWKCLDEGECGFITEKSEKFFSQRLKEMGREVPNGSKEMLGIKTITDEGLK